MHRILAFLKAQALPLRMLSGVAEYCQLVAVVAKTEEREKEKEQCNYQ